MSWEVFHAPAGAHLVNWVAVNQIIRHFLRSQAMVTHSRVTADIRWFGPNLYSIDTDFPRVRAYVNEKAPELLSQIVMNMRQSNRSQDTRYALAHYRAQARSYEEEFRKMVQSAQSQTAAAIDTSVSRGEVALEVATFVRDLSAEVLMVGATVVSGGTAGVVFVFVAGPALKATAKYQDTGNAGAAGVEFGVALTSNFIGKGIDRVASGVGTGLGLSIVANSVTNLTGDSAKAWVEGQSVSVALQQAGMRSVLGVGPETYKTAMVEMIKQGGMSNKAILAGSVAIGAVTTLFDRASAAAFAPNSSHGSLPVPPQAILVDAIDWDAEYVDNFCWVPISGPIQQHAPPPSSTHNPVFQGPPWAL